MYEKTRAEGFGAEVQRRVMVGTYVLSAGFYDAYYNRARKVRALIKQDFDNVFADGIDSILTPATPTAAFGLGEEFDDPIQMYLNDVFTVTVNLAGLPGISVPAGLDANGLPLGLQLIGRPWEEGDLLNTAYSLERAAGFVAKPQACAPQVPNSGIGFGSPEDFQARNARDAALAGPAGQPVTSLNPVVTTIPAQELRAAGIGNGAPLSAINVGGAGAASTQAGQTDTETVAPEISTNNPSISDEQDFSAVASRESIQSDAERRAAQAAAREVIEPTALPTRSSGTGPNIVEYALNAPNVRGQEWYSRSLLSGQGRMQRNCARYNSPDAAQRDFLARGGPNRDPRGIDPDGDGFACGWDPAPFKLAAGN